MCDCTFRQVVIPICKHGSRGTTLDPSFDFRRWGQSSHWWSQRVICVILKEGVGRFPVALFSSPVNQVHKKRETSIGKCPPPPPYYYEVGGNPLLSIQSSGETEQNKWLRVLTWVFSFLSFQPHVTWDVWEGHGVQGYGRRMPNMLTWKKKEKRQSIRGGKREEEETV